MGTTGGGVNGGAADAEAVAELLTDIEAEMRLHHARVQEFLDGTQEFEPVTEPRERVRLLRTAQVLASALSDLTDVSA
jgi:hypothetical protein